MPLEGSNEGQRPRSSSPFAGVLNELTAPRALCLWRAKRKGRDEPAYTRMLHKSLVRGLARPLNAGLFEPIGACASSSHE